MKLKLLHFLSAAILAMASTAAFADPIVIGAQVPGSDPSSEPCTPKERTDDYHKNHFSADISDSQGKDFDVVLFGDSITDFWNNPSLALDGDPLNYAAAFNMGIGSDRVQNLLWRLRNGALDGYTTKYFTLMVGINNGHQKCIDHNEHADRAEDVAESIRLMLCEMATKHPDAKILLMPILPYSFDSKYFEAAEVTEMSEAVNDYILQFVDNKRVFWVDLRSQYLQQNSMPDKTCYREGGHGGYDAVGLCLHPEFFTYSDFWRPALTNAMQKYLSVPAGQAQTADPSIGYAKAAPNVDGAGSATITVFGISLGRDANANAVTSYSIDYELDGGTKTRALSGQTGTRASFAIPNVALGDHTCKVTVTTADNKELVTLLSFTMTEPWYASPLPTDDSAVRTDGTLKYAYAPAACTVNGVAFAAAGNSNAAISGDISWPYSQTSGASAPSSVSGAYHELLNRCWWANQGDKEVTLKNLEAGRSYLVQIFGYRNYNGDGKAHVWIKESYWDPNFIKVYGDGWSCGGTLTGTFTATETTKTFTITSDGNYGINGIQVRDLGESGVPVVVLPKVGSVSATTNGASASVFLSGIAMGTDDAGESATSYSVSYRLGDAAPVTALTGQTAATASFTIAGLADGDYTCAVSITTDKNKTSAEKTVSFRIGTPPPPVVAPSIGSAAASVVSSNATITLSDIVLGTDDDGAAATSYAVSYALNGGAAVAALANQTAASASFQIADLADGSYTCEVSITTDKGKTATKSVSFAISTSGGGGGGGSAEEGWTGGAADAEGTVFRKDGTLLYAYAVSSVTVNGIAFAADADLNTADTAVSPDLAQTDGNSGSESVTGDFGTMLKNSWEWANSTSALTITLKGLTAGKRYLVQVLAHNKWSDALISAGDLEPMAMRDTNKYGASLVCVFDATGETEDIAIKYSGPGGWRALNAIQVRDLGEGGGGGSEETPVYTLTIPAKTGLVLQSVTTNGIAVAAASGNAYSIVSNDTATITFAAASGYEIVGGNPVELTVTGDRTLADAEYPAVQQAGGGGSGGDFELGWTVSPMSADGDTIVTNGTLVYAVSVKEQTIRGVSFEGAPLAPEINNKGYFSFSTPMTGMEGESAGREGYWPQNENPDLAAFGQLLSHIWWWTNSVSGTTLTLKGLTRGRAYLVQLIAHDARANDLTISARGTTPKPVRGSSEEEYKYGASIVGTFVASAETENVFIEWAGSDAKRPLNAVQVRDLGEVFVPVVEPSIGTLSAALSGPTAVIVLGDVEKGTDDEGVAATSYAVSYALDGGEPAETLWNQTGWSAWFNVTNLADGAHTVEVTIATDAGGVASKTVSFTVDSTAPATSAWIVEPMSMSGDTIRTEGDLLYAEAPNLAVVNGVRFERTLWVSDASFTVSPAPADVLWSGMGNEGFNNEANAYGYLLTHAWAWDKSATNTAATVTLTGLEPGKNYLVQLVSHNQYTDAMTVSVEGTEPKPIGTHTPVENQGTFIPWRYGASLVGFFTASDTTQEFTIQWAGAAGYHPLNALQVRDLGLAVPIVVEPSIGAASATVDDDSKTAFITLSGVVKGTDDQCNPANAYDVSYELDGGASVVALEGRTGATAAFSIKNLADGPHECVVTITTDAGKSASATVSFTINEQTPPWIVEPMTEDGDTIRTNGVRRWAFCVGEDSGTLVANGVQFTTFENLDATRLQNAGDIQMPFSVSPAINSAVDGWGTEGVADAGYAQILDRAFYNGASGEYTFTINGNLSALKAGRRYLVQIIMHRSGSTATATVSGFDVDHVQFGGTGWTYGGSLIGTFVAPSDKADHTFTVKFAGGDFAAINAIQLRDLGPAVPTEEDPSIESVSGKRKATSATVALSGVVMGTDADFHPATSYAVSYRLDGGAWTTVLPSENGETASFELAGLEYRTYVCEVKIETDVGKSTEPQTVTLAFAKADGLAIVLFDVEKEALAFDMGSESSVRAMLPDATDIYCTLVTSTNLADVVWTPALPSLAWKANELPLDDESGWTWVDVDTTDAVRFFRVALTAAPLAADDEVVFK